MFKIRKNYKQCYQRKMNINSVLDYINTNSQTGMATCKEWTKKDALEEFQNGAHLEDEETEYLGSRGY